MPQLYAQPYDLTATGFYFDSMEDYAANAAKVRNAFGDPVEEFEIQFIDGSDMDCALAQAWGLNQANTKDYFRAAEDWDDHDKTIFIIAVGECGYSFDPSSVSPDDFDVSFYCECSMIELAEMFVAEGLFGDIPDHLSHYIDYEAIARDLAMDYAETTIAGDNVIYRAH